MSEKRGGLGKLQKAREPIVPWGQRNVALLTRFDSDFHVCKKIEVCCWGHCSGSLQQPQEMNTRRLSDGGDQGGSPGEIKSWREER